VASCGPAELRVPAPGLAPATVLNAGVTDHGRGDEWVPANRLEESLQRLISHLVMLGNAPDETIFCTAIEEGPPDARDEPSRSVRCSPPTVCVL
jgi:uncharacterized protein (DUF58 family)